MDMCMCMTSTGQVHVHVVLQVALIDIEAGFDSAAFTGRPIPPPHTLGGLAGHGLKSIKVVCEGNEYMSIWLPRTSRGAGKRHDIGPWANLCMAVHETRADQVLLIIGWASRAPPPSRIARLPA